MWLKGPKVDQSVPSLAGNYFICHVQHKQAYLRNVPYLKKNKTVQNAFIHLTVQIPPYAAKNGQARSMNVFKPLR